MDNNEYISKQKVEKWTTKEKFNALELSTIEPGTEYNLTGAIEEGELDSALQTKINGKLTAPTTPTAESAVTMLADGTVGTKLLSEIGGGGKLYLHQVPFKKSDNAITSYITFYSSSDQSTSDSKLMDIIQKNGFLFQGSNNMGMSIAGVLLPANENNFDSCDFAGINLVTGEIVEATGAKFIKQNETITEI